uniref:Uncharacterized protein n=3 Tax=Aegilops tauschii subsp. strangulata TaxID=200361 RepID=A0A453MYB8_AEGTS
LIPLRGGCFTHSPPPQSRMSCEVGEMLPPAAAPPLDDGNLLSEILLRLPPLPSSLPRASLVCKRWRCLTSDPAFARRFRIHHRRNPPLLGYFHGDFDGLRFEPVHFEPTLEAPDRVPPGRLSLQFDSYARVLGCRHGLVLILDQAPVQLLVWDPVTGHQHRLPTHTEFDLGNFLINGVVLRSAAGEVHFQVVLVVSDYEKRLLTCVYSSETGVWGTLISTPVPSENSIVCSEPAVLVGDSLYWILAGRGWWWAGFALCQASPSNYGRGSMISMALHHGGWKELLSWTSFSLWIQRIP